jgi:hypothetical protein
MPWPVRHVSVTIPRSPTLPTGETVTNPLRVVPNSDGAEVVFTLFQRTGMTDDELARDEAAVRRDLETLRAILIASLTDRT